MILILMINCSHDLDHRSSIVLVHLVGELASGPVEEYRVEDCQDCLLGLILIMIMIIRKNQYHNDIDNDDNDENHNYEITTITTCHPSTASSNTWLLQK